MSDFDTKLRPQFYLGKLTAYLTIKVMISQNAFESLDELVDSLDAVIFCLENSVIPSIKED